MPSNLRAEGSSVKRSEAESPCTRPDAADRPTRPGFVRVPHHVTALPELPDFALRAWIAIQGWTWRGSQPTNAELAAACGWVNPLGVPSISKAKRAIRALEAAGLIRREIRSLAGRTRREAIVVERAMLPIDGSNLNHRRAEPDPYDGSKLGPGHRSKLAPSEDRCRKTRENPPRPAERGSSRTTTTGKVARPAAPTPGPTRGAVPVIDTAETQDRRQIPIPDTSSPNPTSGLTPGQSAFLARLEDERLRAAFDARSEKERALWLDWFKHGHDAGFWKEVSAMLRPRIVRPIPKATDPLPALWEALARRDPEAIAPATARIVQDLDNDQKSFQGIKARVSEVVTGRREIGGLVEAYRQATGAKARNPGAVFMHAIKVYDRQHQPDYRLML